MNGFFNRLRVNANGRGYGCQVGHPCPVAGTGTETPENTVSFRVAPWDAQWCGSRPIFVKTRGNALKWRAGSFHLELAAMLPVYLYVDGKWAVYGLYHEPEWVSFEVKKNS